MTDVRNSKLRELLRFFNSHRFDALIIVIICIFHWFFSLTSKLYFVDEFLYTSRGWEVEYFLFNGSFAYYPVFDHPSLGWILMGLFGTMFQSLQWTIRTRLLIVILFSIEIIVLYSIMSKYFSRKVAIINLVIFGFQPYSIYLNTMTILDNVGMFFIIMGICFMKKMERKQTSDANFKDSGSAQDKSSLRYFYISAFFAGLALTSKFTMVLFLPGYFIIYITQENLYFKLFQKIELLKQIKLWFKWILLYFTPFLIYLLYILIFNYWNDFVWRLLWQFERIMDSTELIQVLITWIQGAPFIFLMILFISPCYFLVFILKILIDEIKLLRANTNKQQIMIRLERSYSNYKNWYNLFGISSFFTFYLIFIFRGGVVIFHYAIPLIILSPLFLSGLLYNIEYFIKSNSTDNLDNRADNNSKKNFELINKNKLIQKIYYHKKELLCLSWVILGLTPWGYAWLFKTSSSGLYQALNYIDENFPRDSTIIVNDFFVAELRDLGFQYVQLVWFVRSEDFNNNWENIDYFIAQSSASVRITFTNPAVDHCVEIISFQIDQSSTERIRIFQVVP